MFIFHGLVSHLSEELERQLSETKLSVEDLVNRSGISRSQIYNWKSGEQTSISEEQMNSLALSISHDPSLNALLVRAHLLDERFGPGADRVRVEIMSDDELKDLSKTQSKRKSKREQALEYLSQLSLTSRATTDMLVRIANSHGAKI